MIDITRISSRYKVKRLTAADADDILRLCRANTLYYRYCEAEATKEQILIDLTVTPPGIGPDDKYYLGFRAGGELVAVTDLIDGYPAPEYGFIGFFMMNTAYQGKQIGSAIVREMEQCLKDCGKKRVRLGIDKDNPQSSHFWQKNGYTVIREVPHGNGRILVAEKEL